MPFLWLHWFIDSSGSNVTSVKSFYKPSGSELKTRLGIDIAPHNSRILLRKNVFNDFADLP